MGPRRPLLLPSTLLLLACGGGTEPSSSLTENRTLFVEGEPRTFVLHAPEDPAPTALVIAFHGAGSNGIELRANTDLDEVAADLNAAIAYPNADHFNWSEDCGCTNADVVHGVADTAFVSAIIESVTSEFSIPPSNIYAVGFSQGGMFAQRLACQMSSRFEAVAAVASTMSVPLSEQCAPDRPVSQIMMLSETDPFFPWAGSTDGALSTLAAEDAMRLWSDLNGCEQSVASSVNGGLIRHHHEGCAGGAQLELIGVPDGNHAWQLGSELSTGFEIKRFFALVGL